MTGSHLPHLRTFGHVRIRVSCEYVDRVSAGAYQQSFDDNNGETIDNGLRTAGVSVPVAVYKCAISRCGINSFMHVPLLIVPGLTCTRSLTQLQQRRCNQSIAIEMGKTQAPVSTGKISPGVGPIPVHTQIIPNNDV